MTNAHLVVAGIVCIAVPLGSHVEGSRLFAWSMFAAAGDYKLEVTAFDAEGRARAVNPNALAQHAAPSAVRVLGGADHWRSGASLATLRAHLDDLARHACAEEHASEVRVTLFERAPERATSRRVTCVR